MRIRHVLPFIIKKWEVAAEAAEAVISSEIYKLYP